MPQGMILTPESAAKQLQENNRNYYNQKTWEKLFSDNNYNAMRAENQLVRDYTQDSAAAYVSYLKNKNTLLNSDIVGEGRQQILNSNEQALQEAYNSYRQNLTQNLQSVENARATNEQAITEQLQYQGEMMSQYNNLHYNYLEELYNQYLEGENQLFADELWSRYLTKDQLVDEEGNLMYDEQGNPLYSDYRLKTQSELTNPSYEEVTLDDGTIRKDYTSLYDEQGNLTVAGVEFFDFIENALATQGGYSWGDFLSENYSDVYDWATSYNPYNYTQEGSQAGTFRTMTGRMSTDYLYSFAERFGGLTQSQIDDMYKEYTDKVEQLTSDINAHGKDKGKGYISDITDMFSSIQDMAKELGIDADLENEMGMSWDQLSEQLNTYLNASQSSGEMAANWFADFLGTGTLPAIGQTLVIGGGLASAVGGSLASVPVVGQALLAALIVAQTAYGITNASINTDNQRKLNQQLAQQANQLFKQSLADMVNYSYRKRREADENMNGILY